ncbi:hypothetical protein H8L32_20610 [Undibacterium sp. CY18W]|uniref:Uncharacterized protein n=1 Tax=Undibacterium hunanense TaxID=2762292 RepID=A0ABR6ZVQ6_9BURK|nr:hypothetical protein [Undibacterium hunanense]MBC3919884.1 hypothetical protein [Undibacterium hunanense]
MKEFLVPSACMLRMGVSAWQMTKPLKLKTFSIYYKKYGLYFQAISTMYANDSQVSVNSKEIENVFKLNGIYHPLCAVSTIRLGKIC